MDTDHLRTSLLAEEMHLPDAGSVANVVQVRLAARRSQRRLVAICAAFGSVVVIAGAIFLVNRQSGPVAGRSLSSPSVAASSKTVTEADIQRTWTVVAYLSDGVQYQVPTTVPKQLLEFDHQGLVSISGGLMSSGSECTSASGTWTLTDSILELSDLAIPAILCGQPETPDSLAGARLVAQEIFAQPIVLILADNTLTMQSQGGRESLTLRLGVANK